VVALVDYALIHSTGSSFWLAADSIGRKEADENLTLGGHVF
jgi:hypothetical protein